MTAIGELDEQQPNGTAGSAPAPTPAAINNRNADESPQSVMNVIRVMDERVRRGDLAGFEPVATGFAELDQALGGGFTPGQLILLSGPAGVGKTSLMLQIARNMALGNRAACLFVCYEHETDYLAQRLVSMESIAVGDGTPSDGLRMRDIAELVARYSGKRQGMSAAGPGFTEAISYDPRGVRALQRISRYSQNLHLMKGSSARTTVEALSNSVQQIRAPGGAAAGKPVVLFVDYLQKVASTTPHTSEEARNFEEVEGLKELALDQRIVVVAIAAADVEGLKAQRLRLQHMLTSAGIAYEADLIILMNEKYDIVDHRHIEYNRHNAEAYHQYVVLSIEKNRAGADMVDLELRKQLQFCHFRTDARRVQEHLVTGRPRE
ncbi:MAG: DnaB-like helicase C-terminal domain-containing protein [Chloroflexia bacterium]